MLFKRVENISEIGTGHLRRFSSEEDRYYLDVYEREVSWFSYTFHHCEVIGTKMILYQFKKRLRTNVAVKIYDI